MERAALALHKVKALVLYENIPINVFFAVKEFFPDICSQQADNATIKIPETKQKEVVDGKKDFINEGKKLQEVCKLNPNIVNVNEVFEANGTAYYVLEYLEGGDLRKMVRDNGSPLTEQQMLNVMLPIGRALQCLHDNRMLHLDVKPDNIVMRRNPLSGILEPELIDFGISAHFNKDGTPTSKTPSQGISPGYSPIEQYSQVMRFDPKIDVYAYCATCLYLLSAKDPIEATNIPHDFVKNELPTSISSNVANAIVCGMSKDKVSRTATIGDVLAMFSNKDIVEPRSTIKIDGQTTEKKEINTSAFVPQKTQKASPKHGKKLFIVLTVLVVAALIVGIALLSKRCGNTVVSNESDNSDNSSNSSYVESVSDHDLSPRSKSSDELESPVFDYANVLTEEDISEITRKIIDLDKLHLAEVAVLLVPSFEGKTPHDFAADFGNKIGVGSNVINDGIVIAIKPKTDDSPGQAYIASGLGIEKIIPDEMCKNIIDEEMIPEFKQNDYGKGIMKALDRIEIILTENYTK